jgi:hypothetical protein
MSDNNHEIFPTTIWGFTKQFPPGYLEKVSTTIVEMSKTLPNRDKSNFLGHGAEISGVFYVKVPEGDSGRLVLVDPRTRVNMSEKRLRSLNFPIDPKEGTFVLFPSWLEHYVEPNKSDDIRISISFNLR